MNQNAVCILALPDEHTAQHILGFREWMTAQGFSLQAQPLPPYLLLGVYPASVAGDMPAVVRGAAPRTRAFSLTFSHVGITQDGCTLFLAPDVNRPLLALRDRLPQCRGCLVHMPLISAPAPVIQQALPYVTANFGPTDARITALAVCRVPEGQLLDRVEL